MPDSHVDGSVKDDGGARDKARDGGLADVEKGVNICRESLMPLFGGKSREISIRVLCTVVQNARGETMH